MKKKTLKAVGALTGAAVLATGFIPANEAAIVEENAVPAVDAIDGVKVEMGEEVSYDEIAEVKGEFAFCQDHVAPADEVFNLFGTVTTGICAKPGFAMDEVKKEDYYINVGGQIKKAATYTIEQLKEMEAESKNMVCSCGTSAAVVQTKVTGVAIADIVEMAEIEEGVNTITMRSADGYGIAMPLEYVLDKEALLVYAIADQEIPAGEGSVQVWMPETVAKYFTRQVTEIELTAEEDVPELIGVDDEYRVKSIINRLPKDTFAVGDQIVFEGYADDCGVAIESIEFSLDGGKTWTVCETEGAVADKWVTWSFAYVAEAEGTYKLDVRARNAEGKVTPLASSVVFTVE